MTIDELDRLDALHAAMTSGEWEDGGEASISTTFDHEANIYPPEAKPGEDQVGGPLAVVNTRGDGREGNARGIVAMHNSYPALSAALKVAWAERDRLAARLAEAEELLRPFSEWYAKWGEEIATEAKSAYRDAAAFLANTEPAK